MPTAGIHFVLASASPRRAELLRAAGFRFDVRVPDVDEARHPGEAPEAYVLRMAETKAAAVQHAGAAAVVLGADTIVLADDRVLGKPADRGDASRMLGILAGRTHEVLTGVCLAAGGGKRGRSTRVERTTVEFAPMSAQEIDWYVASGEPLDKAGAYAIQGLASRFVTRIDGSYANVVGLPVALVYDLCKDAGILVS